MIKSQNECFTLEIDRLSNSLIDSDTKVKIFDNYIRKLMHENERAKELIQ